MFVLLCAMLLDVLFGGCCACVCVCVVVLCVLSCLCCPGCVDACVLIAYMMC